MTNRQSPSNGQSTEPTKVRKYDLEERTHRFSKTVRNFVRTLPPSIANNEDSKQLIRSSGSICANYMEAAEAVSKKGFLNQIKICKREAKESWHWLDCLDVGQSPETLKEHQSLLQESMELVRIFSASIRTLQH